VSAIADEDARANAVNWLLGALRQNGQILGRNIEMAASNALTFMRERIIKLNVFH
jgi:predicted  nucleic acid-binding Zn ribbon protein